MKNFSLRLKCLTVFFCFALFPFSSYAQQIIKNELPTYDILSNPSSIGVDPRLINAAMTIPITVPAGTNKIQPNIAITYKFNTQNNLLGVGWGIDFDCIERSTKRGIPKYNTSDTFELVQSGVHQDLVFDSANNLYHPEIESSFLKIEFLSDRWVITDRAGTKFYFGASEDSKQGDAGNVYRWYLNKIEDVHGNYMAITYVKYDNQVYPYRMDYTGNSAAGLLPYAQVEFELDERAILYSSYQGGFLIKTTKRISRIYVKAQGALQRRYDFGYTQSTATKRDLLVSVTQYGSDGSSSLPPTVLTYYGGEKGFVEVSNAGVPQSLQFSEATTGGNFDLGVRIADINSDGYPDILKSYKDHYGTQNYYSRLIRETYLNNRNNTWSLDSSWSVPEKWSGSLTSAFISEKPLPAQYYDIVHRLDSGLRIVDVDGDYKNDLIQSLYHLDTVSYNVNVSILNGTYLNLGNGWASDNGSWYLPSEVNTMYWFNKSQPSYDYFGWRYEYLGNTFADVNNDGYVDIVTSRKPPSASYPYNGDGVPVADKRTFLNNLAKGGTGWAPNSGWAPPNTSYTDFYNGADLVDLNGDGLPDIFYRKDGLSKVYMNTGKDWQEDTASGWNDTFGYGDLVDGSTQFGDINGDGLLDMIIAKGNLNSGSKVLINTGNGWSMDDAWVMPEGDFRNIGTRLLDADADMMLDFMIHYNGNSPKLYRNKSAVADMLKSLENGTGASTTLQYGSSAHFTNTFLPFTFPVIIYFAKSNSLGDSYETRYSYTGGFWVPAKREFRGFGLIRVTDPEGSYTETNYLQDDIKKGKISEQRTYDSSGKLIAKLTNTWESQTISSGVNFVFLKKKDSLSYAKTTGGKRSAEEYFYEESPQLGNSTKVIQYGEVDFATGVDIDTDKRTVETVYLNNTASVNWIIGFPRLITVKNAGDELMRKTWLSYDNQENTIPPTKGLSTKKEEWAGDQAGAVNPITRFAYNSFGMLTSTTDPKDNTTITTYDTQFGIFPLTVRNVLSHTIVNEYYGINAVSLDSGDGFKGLWGEIKSTTDPNNQKTRQAYDTFGRLILTVSPLDTIDFPTETIQYQLNSTYTQIISAKRINHGAAGTFNTHKFYDGLGRLMQTRTPASTTDKCIVKEEARYNFRDLPVETYLAFFSNYPIDILESIDTAKPHSTTVYDAIGRIIRFTNSDSTYKTIEYDAWTTRTIDENGHKQESDLDAFGRLKTKREYKGADGRFPTLYPNTGGYTLYATTQYNYDSEGNLIKITDAHGNITNISYDKLGYKISLDDPDMGIWAYEYDLKGNLNKQTDNKAQIIQMVCDGLNRLTNKTGLNLDIAYTYDDTGVSFSKGRLTRSQYASGNTQFGYDALGRETKRIRTISSSTYTTESLYDALNRLTSLKYPDQLTLNYAYDAGGQVKSINANLPPTNPAPQPPILNSATSGDQSVTLTWSASTGATGYKVKYGTQAGNYPTVIDVGSVTSRQITNLTNGTTYYFAVTAYNAGGESGDSNERSATPQIPPSVGVVFDAATSSQVDNATGISLTHTVTSTGANRVLVAEFALKDATVSPTVSGVTYAGRSLTFLTRMSRAVTGKRFQVEFWYLLDPPTGANTLSASFNTNVDGITCGAVSLTGVKQQAPRNGRMYGTSTTASTNITTVENNSYIIDALVSDEVGLASVTPYAGQTQRLLERNVDACIGASSTKLLITNGTTSMSWTLSASKPWAIVAAAFAPAAQPLAYNNSNSAHKNFYYAIKSGIMHLAKSVLDYLGPTPAYAATALDFTTFTESDPDNEITKTADSVTYANIETLATNAYVYKSYPTSGDFNSKFDCVFTTVDASAGPYLIWGLSNTADKTFEDWVDGVYVAFYKTSTTLRIKLGGIGTASRYSSYLTAGIRYYITVTRAGSTVTVSIYSDSVRTALVSTLTSANSTPTFAYVYALSAQTLLATGRKASGDVSRLIDDTVIQPIPPKAPVLNTPAAGDTKVTLSWSLGSGAAGYKVKYGTISANYITILDVGNVSSKEITGLTNGTTYYFVVSAYNAYGESPNSNEKSAIPQAPLPAVPVLNTPTTGDSSVSLSWNTVTAATGYKVKYGTTSATYTTILDVGNVTSREVTGLTNGTTYYFVVSAYNSAGESASSAEKSATPQVPAPAAPILNTATAGNTTVDLSWSTVVAAAGYKVKYGTQTGNYTATIDAGNVTATQITNLTNGTTYYFAVSAYNAGGESPNSNELSALPLGPTEVTIVTNAEYNAAGQITRVEYGNGAITEYTYDNNNLRLTRIRTQDAQGAVIQDLSYTYDGVGNVISISDSVNTATQQFQYDELNRLVQADGSGYGSKPFQYDEIGNIFSKDAKSYTYGTGIPQGAGPHTVTSLSDGTAFIYDANGNTKTKTVSDQQSEYFYDIENQLTQVKKNSVVIGEYAYDDTGKRVKKISSGTTTYFAGDLYEEAGNTKTSYIFLGQMRIASVNSSQVFFYHTDHLRSTNLITDNQGVKKELVEYSPYGETSRDEKYGTSQQITNRLFTGQYLDSESDLYYYGARYYSPGLGRFITADWVESELGNPQTLNRYSYCVDNPLRYIDPTGHTYDYAIDPFLVALDLDAFQNDSSLFNGTILLSDAVLAAIPFVPAVGGLTFRGLDSFFSKADDVSRASRGLDKAADINRFSNPYEGVRQVSEYLRGEGVARADRLKIMKAFEMETLNLRTAGKSEFGLRYFDNIKASPKGRFLFETFPASRESLALKPDWNAMTNFKQWQINPGTPIIEGRTASQGGSLIGGDIQKFILNLDDLLEIK